MTQRHLKTSQKVQLKLQLEMVPITLSEEEDGGTSAVSGATGGSGEKLAHDLLTGRQRRQEHGGPASSSSSCLEKHLSLWLSNQ